jgi:2-polyprenyl-3-methyl-5-hydroxy-6-metoxy-1,4-benzoquinol methylase
MLSPETVAAYTTPRADVVAMLSRTPRRCLDIGCSNGALSRVFSDAGADTWGIELDRQLASEADKVLGHVLVGDAGEQVATLVANGSEFDTIIAADILEHTVDPWKIMGDVRKLITSDGQMVVSLPNVRFYTTLVWLVIKGRWRYEDRGVHDRTHLRWFTDANARDMFDGAGFCVDTMVSHYRLVDAPMRADTAARLVARNFPPLRPFLAYQYLYRLSPVL